MAGYKHELKFKSVEHRQFIESAVKIAGIEIVYVVDGVVYLIGGKRTVMLIVNTVERLKDARRAEDTKKEEKVQREAVSYPTRLDLERDGLVTKRFSYEHEPTSYDFMTKSDLIAIIMERQ